MKRDTDKGVRDRLNQREREIRWLGNEFFFLAVREAMGQTVERVRGNYTNIFLY